jgi:hypothetical protein
MNARKRRDLPAPLEAVRRRFGQWRRMRRTRSRIPDSLWAAAVKMAGTYGIHRTARALPVEYYSLKKRVEQHAAVARTRHEPQVAATFVPLPPLLPASVCDCTLELEDAAGSKMRVHLKAAAPPDLAALSRSFWYAES